MKASPWSIESTFYRFKCFACSTFHRRFHSPPLTSFLSVPYGSPFLFSFSTSFLLYVYMCVHVCPRARVFLPFLSSIHITLSLTLSQPVVVKRVSNVERNVHGRYADYANRWKELCRNTATQRFAPGVRAVPTFEIILYPFYSSYR